MSSPLAAVSGVTVCAMAAGTSATANAMPHTARSHARMMFFISRTERTPGCAVRGRRPHPNPPPQSGGGKEGDNGSILEQLERPHHAAGRDVGEVGVADPRHIRPGRAAGHGEVLLAVALPGHGRTDTASAQVELPEQLAALRVDRHELAGE